eukprot:scaffold54498_cov35-Prasinocladus_malaysianus.AAC.1
MTRADGDDVSAHLTAHGLWQAGWYPQRAKPPAIFGPTVQQALLSIIYGEELPAASKAVASAKATVSQNTSPLPLSGLLIDVGAGLGLFSLAAAAKDIKALAIEPEDDLRQPMQQSIQLNGFQDSIAVSQPVIGAEDGFGACVRLELGLSAAPQQPGALPDFDNNERRWRHPEPPLPLWVPGNHCDETLQRPALTRKLDTEVKAYIDQQGFPTDTQNDGDVSVEKLAVVLRIAANAQQVLAGAESLLAGTLSPHLDVPSVILIEAQMSELYVVAELVRSLEQRHGFAGAALHRGANCNPPGAHKSGSTWCKCQRGEFSDKALRAAPTAFYNNDQPQDPEPSFSLVVLHGSKANTSAGTKWLEGITKGAA